MTNVTKVSITAWNLIKSNPGLSRSLIVYPSTNPIISQWFSDLEEMYQTYLRGEPVYVEFIHDKKRTGSIGKITIQNMQEILYGSPFFRWQTKRAVIEEKPENFKIEKAILVTPDLAITWDGRRNRVTSSGYDVVWLKGHTDGTKWSYGTVNTPKATVYDKLGREIQVGDFISYILYHFDRHGAASIYYGTVTKITHDGNIYAKNIKLKEDDRVAVKKIKSPDLIVKMTKDLLSQLTLVRLSTP